VRAAPAPVPSVAAPVPSRPPPLKSHSPVPARAAESNGANGAAHVLTISAQPSLRAAEHPNARLDRRAKLTDPVLAQAQAETRVDWTAATTAPPPRTRSSVWIAAIAIASVIIAGILFLTHSNDRTPRATLTEAPHAVEPPPAPVVPMQIPPAPAPEAPAPTAPSAPAPQPSAASPTATAEAQSSPPANPAQGPQHTSDELLQRGQKLAEQGKPKQALAAYESAAKQSPEDSKVLSRLALTYLNQGRNNDAANYAARAVELEESNSEGWIVLGAARSQLGDRKAAREAYKRCAEVGKGSYVNECRQMLQ
jgi:hypothetical protein